MKYYIIAGEASGDMHAAKLIREIKKLDLNSDFRCWGGDKMMEEGAQVVKHYKDLAFMGFLEVVLNLRTIYHNLKFCKNDIVAYNPDVIILVDYPGFNMRIAKWGHEQGIKVFYYIAPQVWAWKKGRVHKINQYVDHAFVILPFEKDFYAKFGYHVDFCGHPLTDALSDMDNSSAKTFLERNNIGEKPVIAILPGSRKQEILHILPEVLKVVDEFPGYQFILAGVNTLDHKLYEEVLKGKDLPVVYDQTYDLLHNAQAAIVKSGTSTLETALIKIPQVVVYKASLPSIVIAKLVIKVKFISLVNLILGREAVKELIQFDLNKKNLVDELRKILTDPPYRKKMLRDYDELENLLGKEGTSARAARKMMDYLDQNKK